MRKASLVRKYRTESLPLSALIVTSPLFAIYWWTGTPIALALGILILHNSTVARALRMYLPPTALLLTLSSSDTVNLHASLSYYFNAFRIVQLLKKEANVPDFKLLVKRDCFRTDSDDVWEEMVESFIRICPLVILDARQTTQALQSELNKIVQAEIYYKLVVLVDQEGNRPLVDKIDCAPPIGLETIVPVFREAGLLTLLNYIIISFPEFPSKSRTLVDIIQSDAAWDVIQKCDWATRPVKDIFVSDP
jgi:hypothetical protein